ncbi:XerC Integrase [Candidatus Nanopelagicaceae bacterium]
MLFESFALQTINHLPIRQKTFATYHSMLRLHVFPTLAHRDIRTIKRLDIQSSIQGLPPQTSAMSLAVIKTVFREALAQEIIEASPAHGVTGPKIMVKPREFLTWEEVSANSFGKYTTHIRFLALHGLRWSEAVALTIDDIRDDRVWINKSVHGQTKSKAGIRSVPLVSPFKVFPKSPKTLRKVLKPHGVDIHSLRHTYAYLLKQQGVHVTTAQRLLGHSDPRVTMNVYTQVLDNEIDDVGLLLSKAAGF